MRIKKLSRIISFVILIAMTYPATASTVITYKTPIDSNMVSNADKIRAQEILQRLSEIQRMDLSSLSPSQKASLRHELKGMQDEERRTYGVYISLGAAIVIIVVLLLILR